MLAMDIFTYAAGRSGVITSWISPLLANELGLVMLPGLHELSLGGGSKGGDDGELHFKDKEVGVLVSADQSAQPADDYSKKQTLCRDQYAIVAVSTDFLALNKPRPKLFRYLSRLHWNIQRS